MTGTRPEYTTGTLAETRLAHRRYTRGTRITTRPEHNDRDTDTIDKDRDSGWPDFAIAERAQLAANRNEAPTALSLEALCP